MLFYGIFLAQNRYSYGLMYFLNILVRALGACYSVVSIYYHYFWFAKVKWPVSFKAELFGNCIDKCNEIAASKNYILYSKNGLKSCILRLVLLLLLV